MSLNLPQPPPPPPFLRATAVASTLSRLAKVQRILGNNQAALQAIEESLRIKQHNLGPQHPDVASDLMTMAEILVAVVRAP